MLKFTSFSNSFKMQFKFNFIRFYLGNKYRLLKFSIIVKYQESRYIE